MEMRSTSYPKPSHPAPEHCATRPAVMRHASSSGRSPTIARLCCAALLAASALAEADESGTSYETVYWCERTPGQMRQQLNPCGTTPIVELKPGVVYATKPADAVNAIREQNSPGYGTGANAVQEGPDGKLVAPGQAAKPGTDAQPAPQTQISQAEGKALMKEGGKRVAEWIGIALLVGLAAKFLLSRSFWAWFLLGLLVRPVLVSLAIMKF